MASRFPFPVCRNVTAMRIAVAFDHRGVKLRERVLAELAGLGHETVDLGTDTDAERVDYPDKARAARRGDPAR